MNRNSAQQKAGTYEYAKYQAAHYYLQLRVEGVKKMYASVLAAKLFWGNKATTYRSRAIRGYAQEYIKFGKIAMGAQGKHSKRVSVLDDNDIKRKLIEWIRSVPKSHRNLQGIQNHLRDTILPAAVESDTLHLETDTEGAITNPLSLECIRRKLIEWGFSFKQVGKLYS